MATDANVILSQTLSDLITARKVLARHEETLAQIRAEEAKIQESEDYIRTLLRDHDEITPENKLIARTVLGQDGPASVSVEPASRYAPGTGARKRFPKEQVQEIISGVLTKEGQTFGAIEKAALALEPGLSKSAIRNALVDLRDAKKVTTKGERRAMTYALK
jgi:hypothetical protein